ncbi:MAG: hypothetical protein WD844_02835 [Thermoleophilaceae bacterium]
MRLAMFLLAAAALALPACGGDDEPDRGATGPVSPTTGTETAPPAADPGATAAIAPADESEIRDVVVAAATNREPCEHLTERYLEEFVLEGVTSEDPSAACREAEQGQPELRESDVRISAVRGAGDEAEVRFSIAGIEQTAMMVRGRDGWLIDKFDV